MIHYKMVGDFMVILFSFQMRKQMKGKQIFFFFFFTLAQCINHEVLEDRKDRYGKDSSRGVCFLAVAPSVSKANILQTSEPDCGSRAVLLVIRPEICLRES